MCAVVCLEPLTSKALFLSQQDGDAFERPREVRITFRIALSVHMRY